MSDAIKAALPVAWRVKDYADGWIFYTDEKRARVEAKIMNGALVEPLYSADALTSQASGGRATHRHKKTGGEYVLLGIGKMQTEDWGDRAARNPMLWDDLRWPCVDMREVAIYRSVEDGSLWVRPREEFEDGRFEAARGAS